MSTLQPVLLLVRGPWGGLKTAGKPRGASPATSQSGRHLCPENTSGTFLGFGVLIGGRHSVTGQAILWGGGEVGSEKTEGSWDCLEIPPVPRSSWS